MAAWRHLFPFRAVVLPWLVARLVAVPALVLAGDPGSVQPNRLIWMDGLWFRMIALDGYDRPYVAGQWSEFPFFPLFPALGGGLMRLGIGATTALTAISWIASLVALAGAYRLASRHLPARAAAWAPWFIALAPGALGFVMGYADSLFLAGSVWALLLAERRHWWWAGVVAVVATSSRPNGFIAVVALIVMALAARAGARAIVAVALPSMIFLAAWCSYLWWATGDPLVFWSAKDAWDEITLRRIAAEPLAPRNRGALFHLLALLVLAVPYVMRIRRQPIAWAVFPLLGVLPSLVLGIEGIGRYAVLAFPLPFAAADVFTSSSRTPAVVYLAASGSALVLLSVLVVRYSWVP